MRMRILLWILIPELHFIYSIQRPCLDPLTPSKVIVSMDGTHRQTDRQTDGHFFLLVLRSKV